MTNNLPIIQQTEPFQLNPFRCEMIGTIKDRIF